MDSNGKKAYNGTGFPFSTPAEVTMTSLRLWKVIIVITLAAGLTLAGVMAWFNTSPPAGDDRQAAYAEAIAAAKQHWEASKAFTRQMEDVETAIKVAEEQKRQSETTIRALKMKWHDLRRDASWERLYEARAFVKADALRAEISATDAAYSIMRAQAEADLKIGEMWRDRYLNLAVIGIFAVVALTPYSFRPRRASPRSPLP